MRSPMAEPTKICGALSIYWSLNADRYLTWMRIFLKSLRRRTVSSSTRPVPRRDWGGEALLLSVSEPSGAGERESLKTSCSTRPSKTETMIAASRVSLKTMKKMGTEKRLLAIFQRCSKRTKGRIIKYPTRTS